MRARASRIRLWTLAVALLLAATAAHADYVAYAVTKKGELPLPESLDGIKHEELIHVKWGEYDGPQTRVGVLQVDNNSGVGGMTITGPGGQSMTYKIDDFNNQVPVNGIEAMITDVLFRTKRFRMVERASLGEVLQEQNLAASGRMTRQSGAQTGQVLGAQFLVQAVITSYEPNYKGKKGGLGGLTKGLLGGAKIGKSRSMVGMNFRLVDAETSEVLFTKQVDVIVSKSEFDVGAIGWGGGGALGGFMSSYSKTPIGQAVMAGINIGAFELIKQVGSAPQQGSVVKVDDSGKVYVNLGKDAVEVGSGLTAFSRGEELIDPDTGLSLGGEEERVGQLRVASVQDKFCIAEAVDFEAASLDRGDKVVADAAPARLEFAGNWEGKTTKK